jgi:enoyl-CoA hydratase/carnithine racemase
MTGNSPLVDYRRRGAGGWLTLNRPRRRNALTPRLLGDFHRALDACDGDPRVRAVVITGAGDACCAGADLDYFRGVFRRNWNGPDMREGIAAFVERRDSRYAEL